MLLSQMSALSHPHRMALFRLLVRRYPDELPAGEIVQALDLKPSTASVYLSALTQVKLINQTVNGTQRRYAFNPAAAGDMVDQLFLDCCKGRPDLCPPSLAHRGSEGKKDMDSVFNVLFICTANSARSIFAEAILRHLASDRFRVFSAGVAPQGDINPFVLEMLEERQIDTVGLRSKNLSEFQAPHSPPMDFVFTVCDAAANEECPAWRGQPISGHWGLPDPVKATGTVAEQRLAFQQTFGTMWNRIQAFTSLPIASLDRISLQKQIDDIGRTLTK